MANKQAQKVIDTQLADLELRCLDLSMQMRIQELKLRRNTYAPVSKIPDEVLLEIFVLNKTIFPEDESFWRVSHVCRRWRYVAVEAPTLWTKPPLLFHAFTMFMLERSRSADLTIWMEYGTAYKIIKGVLDCIGRIEKLEISLEMDLLYSAHELMATSDQQASRLRSFMLHSLSDVPWDSRPMFALPTFCQLHLLRELDITNVIFDWNVLPLPNLLALSFIDVSLPTRVSMQQFLDTLCKMPHLESLRMPISQSLFPLPPSTKATNVAAQVTLPRLSHLHLSDSNSAHVQWFLSRLTLPRLQRMLITPPRTANDNASGDSSQIVHAIASSITGGGFGTFDNLDLYNTFFQLNVFDQRNINRVDSDDKLPHVHFNIPEDHNAGRLFAQTSVDILLLCRPNLSCLVELKIEELSTTVDQLFRLSTVLCSVRKIEIFRSPETALALIGTLAMLPPHRSPGASNQSIPFPKLKLIQFSVIDFAGIPEIIGALCDCLMLRYEYGFAIQKLDLFECWIFTGQFARLKEIVANVKYRETIR
ncbi:hypothetical protein D9619_005219 [Psilocybe cf. subviscida]|uniref:F-box domain-containing protein n=1 Tax=Psilocybe cf. subviscida TaxID=2480587 RepID=A0A8H5BY58_9AGAR|nr:hypothetical protein D9619_005219 [Psilocybe cf. subviscida]